MNFLKRNFWEIHRSSSLGVMGGLLTLGQIMTYFFWRDLLPLGVEAKQPLLCWSFQANCQSALLSGSTLAGLLYLQLGLSVLATGMFFFRRSVGFAWFGLFFGWVLQLFLYFQDASLRTNAYALHFLISFSFLFLPNKAAAIRYLCFTFFILDAITKLNADWLSGLGYASQLDLPLKGLEWVATFSVVIEMVMPFFLLCRDAQRMGYGFGVLFIYQMLQFYILREPSHLALGLILPFFVFRYFETRRLEIESMYQSYEHPEPTNFWWPAMVSILIGAQFVPKHIVPQLEVLRLEKVQAGEECKTLAFSYSDEAVSIVPPESLPPLPSALKCNPQANFNSYKQHCEKRKTDSSFKNLTVFFLTRGMADSTYSVRFGSDRFCDQSYSASRIGGLSL